MAKQDKRHIALEQGIIIGMGFLALILFAFGTVVGGMKAPSYQALSHQILEPCRIYGYNSLFHSYIKGCYNKTTESLLATYGNLTNGSVPEVITYEQYIDNTLILQVQTIGRNAIYNPKK